MGIIYCFFCSIVTVRKSNNKKVTLQCDDIVIQVLIILFFKLKYILVGKLIRVKNEPAERILSCGKLIL